MIFLEHATQLGQGIRNLCFQACFAMIHRALTGERLTAGQVARATDTADGTFSDPDEIRRIFAHYDVRWSYRRPADMAWWVDWLGRGRLAACLVHYGTLIGSDDDFAHFIVPVGINDEFVWLHDPLRLYGPVKVPRHQFAAAIAEPTPGNTFVEQAWAVDAEVPRMKRGMGYNVHAGFTHDDQWAAWLDQWAVDRPGALLVFDDFNDVKNVNRAIEAAERLPDTTVIYRRFLQGDNQQNYISPSQWVNEHRALAGRRVYCALNNEPHGPALNIADFHQETVKQARAAGIRVSVGGFSVGSPDDTTIEAHLPLLRWMAANPGWAILDLHEYTRALWTVDFARDAKQPDRWPPAVHDGAALWLMGRFRRWLHYCDQIGVKRPQIVIGEWGFDRVQAVGAEVYGDTEGLHTCAPVWQSWGFEDWQQYAAMQLQAAWKAIYAAYPEVLGVCYFQLQTGDKWATFNAYTAPRFMELTREGFDTMAVTQPQPVTGYAAGAYTLDYVGGRVNVRSGPSTSAAVVGQRVHGDPVDVIEATATEANGFVWQLVSVPGLGRGYMATKGGAWTLAPRTVDSEAWAQVKAARDMLTAALQSVGIT